MGVPKFFRYTSERYPCLNELVKQYQIPEFDNMYLDMNGIIHNCSHPDDSNPHFRITEEKIFADIFHYLSILFQIIKPKKLFFMAIDGVAPRAKMNQQRGRRFRSAREAEMQEEKARKKGETLPTEKRFDSNCITPGTVFMARLHEQLRYFVKQKISTDPLWSKCRVILSGHETPGEGEHKIMDYIRWARSQPDYDPDTRHCLYGLDADLIMLGMCTHEPHFALLREEVKFGKSTQRATSPEETNFFLLHLSLLRDYLEQEFLPVKEKLTFGWDMEKIIDDWVLMGFLVGNDFIPNLPNMHISNDALPLLYKTYMTVLPTLDGYINESGVLNLARFETFMQELSKIDTEAFQETYTDLRYFQEKTGRRPNANERKVYKPNDDETFDVNIDDIKSNKNDDLQALISATDDLFKDIDDDVDGEYEDTSDEEANFANEFALHKKDYYMNKLEYEKVTPEVMASQAEGYVRAIQWNLYYYYRGCPSWCWFYPHHYAPYMSDIKGFKDLKIEFELGEPFKPFQQLLAVLPAASKELLPKPFHALMTDDDSPIFSYYPVNFETDLNGKVNEWEAVVLIPFIDEKKLLEAMEPCYSQLTPEEIKRNTHGPMLVYNFSLQSLGELVAPAYFPCVRDCRCSETAVWRTELDVPPAQLRSGLLPGAHTQFYFLGFPTLKHLQYKTYIKKSRCKVFDQPSRNDNMIVELVRQTEEPGIESLVSKLLGKVVWVGWPHLQQAKVISISNEKLRYHISKGSDVMTPGVDDLGYVGYEIEENKGNMHKQWMAERSTIIEHNMGRMGLELGPINTIIHAVNLRGYKYIVEGNTSLAVEQVWCEVPCGYAHQAVLEQVEHKSTAPRRNMLPQDVFPPGAQVFLMTGPPYYGAFAEVVSCDEVGRSGRVKVQVSAGEEPSTSLASASVGMEYRPAHHIAASTGITPQLLSRLTGVVFLVPGKKHNGPTENINKINIGLNLKFNKKNQEVTGYTRRCPTTNQWLYSTKCQQLVEEYAKNFPGVVDMLSYSLNNDVYFESDIWPGQVGKGKPQELSEWLKQQPHNSAPRRDCGSESLEPQELVRLAESIDKQLQDISKQDKKVTLQVKIGLLYKPDLHEGNIPPDPQADFQMYDRVVCAAANLTVPTGAKGTITAVYRPGVANTVRLSDKLNSEPSYQILFDEPFPGAMGEEHFTNPRFYRLSGCHLINISYGRKIREARVQPAPDVYQPRILRQNKTQLRSNDGHNSAFASYSPTKERYTPKSTDLSQDIQDSTIMLKSLLKIQQPDNNEHKKPSKPSNWRTDRPPQNVYKKQTSPPHNRNFQTGKDSDNSNVTRSNPIDNTQDNSTTMLKSLLKIQQPVNSPKQDTPTQQSWQKREPLPHQAQPHHQAPPPRPQTAPLHPQAAPPYSQATPSYSQATPSYPQATPPHPQATHPYPQATPPYPQATPPYPQSTPSHPQANLPHATTQQHNMQPRITHRAQQQPQNWRNECVGGPPQRPPNWNPSYLQNRPPHMQNQMGVLAPPGVGMPFAPHAGRLPAPPLFRPPTFPLPPTIMPNFMAPVRPAEPPNPSNLPSAPFQQIPPPPSQANQHNQQPATNPFVPLQVVAKQRRAQNAGAPAVKDVNVATERAQSSDVRDKRTAPSAPANQQTNPQNNADASKRKKKPKSRIAASLPISLK